MSARPGATRWSCHFERLLALTPMQFEHEVADLLRSRGFRRVAVSGRSGDLSADITARDEDGRSVIVQCKRYAPHRTVGSPAVQQFIGMATTHHRAERMMYVTTGGFTRAAVDLARKHKVELIDGARLVEVLAETRGVPESPHYFLMDEIVRMPSDVGVETLLSQKRRLQEERDRAIADGCSCVASTTRSWQMDGDVWNEHHQFVVRCAVCGRVATDEEVEQMRHDLEAHVASDRRLRSV